jgi:hypothetical protein
LKQAVRIEQDESSLFNFCPDIDARMVHVRQERLKMRMRQIEDASVIRRQTRQDEVAHDLDQIFFTLEADRQATQMEPVSE